MRAFYLLRDRLTAGQQTLNLFIMVRIHVSEPSSTRSGRPEQGTGPSETPKS